MNRWESDEPDPTPEPFFAHAEPCESCGLPVWGERFPASWDTSLLIGECCRIDFETIVNQPMCPAFWPLIERAMTCYQVSRAFEEHLRTCPECQGIAEPKRRPIAAETSSERKEAAA